MTRATNPTRRRSTGAHPEPAPRAAWLTRGAFVLSCALVVARATMLETLRNPLDVHPNSDATPDGPGAGTGLVLDLLCCVPALMVLARRAFDPTYALRFHASFVPLGLLAAWTLSSALWAGDTFAAAVGGAHWLCACVFLWSAAQLARGAARLRLAGAVCVGLLLAQAGEGLYYRYVSHPELVSQWKQQREEIIRQRGWEPDSYVARQFENRVLSGEIMGFTSSPNSYAAVLVLLGFVAVGVTIQRLADGDGAAWAAVPGLVAALAGLMLVFVGSRTGLATPVVGVGLLAVTWSLRGWLARRAGLAYALAVAGAVLAVAAVVGHGLHHGTLFQDSLTFRWRYWVAAARLFANHPLVGVGWENFGPHYLAYRLPVAAEEIKDPHNFVVRFATELGAVGLALLLAWLLRLAWELTRPRRAVAGDGVSSGGAAGPNAADVEIGAGPYQTENDRQFAAASSPELALRGADGTEPPAPADSPLRLLAWVGGLGILLNVVSTLDPTQEPAYNALELIRRLGLLCLFLVGAAPAALRSARQQETDDRPAPWVYRALLVALALFLLHNFVDFSLFEPGPMFLFMFLAGVAGGAAGSDPGAEEDKQKQAGRLHHGSKRTVIAVAVASLVWLVAAGGFAGPVVSAERDADAGDEALRTRRFGLAAGSFERAMSAVPYNADYAFRAARALLADNHPAGVPRARALLDRAVALDPNRPQYWLHRAYARIRGTTPDPAGVRADYDAAIRLDPNNVDVRLEYGDVLRRLGDAPAAAEQYREALRFNDLLSPDEPKRLPPKRVEEVRADGEVIGEGSRAAQ